MPDSQKLMHHLTKRDFVDNGAIVEDPLDDMKDDLPFPDVYPVIDEDYTPPVTRRQARVYYNEDCKKAFGRDDAECSCYHCKPEGMKYNTLDRAYKGYYDWEEHYIKAGVWQYYWGDKEEYALFPDIYRDDVPPKDVGVSKAYLKSMAIAKEVADFFHKNAEVIENEGMYVDI